MKNYYIKQEAAVNLLYVKEIGPGKQYEIETLENLPLVKKVIVADYSLQNNNKFNLKKLVNYYLLQADCIFIAGSAFDPSPRYSSNKTTRIAPNTDREDFEIALLNEAKKRGLPILAVCAGSWRLTNAYGAQTYSVPEQNVHQHERWDDARNPDEVIKIKPQTMLSGIHIHAQKNKQIVFSYEGKALKNLVNSTIANTNFDPHRLKVNTTHWRVSPLPESQIGTEFNFLFETSAISVEHDTVEFYESKYGVPIYAKQFHSEYTIPEVSLKNGNKIVVNDYKTHRGIIEAFIENGLTFRRKQNVIKQISEERSRLSKPQSKL